MVLILLLFVMLGLFTMNYCILGHDIMSPPALMSAGFLLSIIFALTQMETWGLNDFHWNTFCVISGSVLLFSIGYYVALILLKSLHRRVDGKLVYKGCTFELPYIKINNTIVIIFIMFAIVVGFVYLKAVIQIAAANGASGNLGNYLYIYRRIASFGDDNNSSFRINRLVKYSYQFVCAVGYFWCYILVNNYIKTRKFNKLVTLAVLACIIVACCNANRMEFVFYPISMLVIYFVLISAHKKWYWKSQIKYISRIIFLMTILALVFSASSSIIGRNVQGGIFYNLVIYIGSPIKLLDMFIQSNKLASSTIWGQETFASTINYLLSKTQYAALQYSTQKEFSYYNGLSLGNVYSGLRCYLHDFGYYGIVIILPIYGALFSLFYENIKVYLVKAKYIVPYRLIFYSYLVHCVCLEFYSNYFFERTLTTSMLIRFVSIWIFGKLYIEFQKTIPNIKFIIIRK